MAAYVRTSQLESDRVGRAIELAASDAFDVDCAKNFDVDRGGISAGRRCAGASARRFRVGFAGSLPDSRSRLPVPEHV
jgi:hypothetical protein